MAPPTANLSSATAGILPNPTSTAGSRSRPQARKKPNDDAAYFGPPPGGVAVGLTVGAKRHASDRADGEPRVKRKRLDATNMSISSGGRKADRDKDKIAPEGDLKVSMVSAHFHRRKSIATRLQRISTNNFLPL